MKQFDFNITKAISSSLIADEAGFVSMAQLGLALSEQGITAQTLGVDRLAHYFLDRSDLYEMGPLNSCVRLRSNVGVNLISTSDKEDNLSNKDDNAESETKCLTRLARFDWMKVLPLLADMASLEDWKEDGYPFGRLYKYIKAQYTAACNEGLVLRSTSMISFCSGLYTRILLEPIYIVLKRKNGDWVWDEACSRGSGKAKKIYAMFGTLPQRPTYGNPTNRYFDLRNFNSQAVDFAHIFHRVSRLPLSWVKQYSEKLNITACDMTSASPEEEKAYNAQFYEALSTNPTVFLRMREAFQSAISRAQASVEESFSEAVVGYNPKKGEIIHLIPIALVDPMKADLALVVTKENGTYQAPTILSLKQARNAARIIGRIHNSWLH